jgi:uncharacterized protein YacL
MENKFSKILFIVWMVLAIASFVASFWAPIVIKVIGLVFGGLNLMIIGSWVISYFQEKIAAKKMEEQLIKIAEQETTKPKKAKKNSKKSKEE